MSKKKEKSNLKIAFDLDGVVYNMVDTLDKYMSSIGKELLDDTSYDMGKRYGISKSAARKALDNLGTTRPFRTMPLYHEAKKEMERLSKNYELYIITHRNWCKNGIEDTLERIKQDELPVKSENIIFSHDKGYWANNLGIYMFYEDCIDNVKDILKKSDSLVALVDAPYNQEEIDGVLRIKW